MPPKKPVQTKSQTKTSTTTKTSPVKASQPKGTAIKKGVAAGGKKAGGAPPKGKAGVKTTEDKPKERVWTKQDDAARKIQTYYRKYEAKKTFEKKKKKKEEYEDLMDSLEKEAFVKLVKMQQEEAERERKKDEEERRRKAEQKKRIKRVLEAAFDGDNDEILTVLREVSELDDKNGISKDDIGHVIRQKHLMAIVDCEDANENTPVSDAANGGNADTILLFLERGANPNTIGHFRRTPLYRAAFGGHLEACQVLLQNGADPRIYASDGQTPEQVASVESVRLFLESWDISQTELLLKKLEAETERRLEDDRKRREAEQNKLEQQISAIKKEYETKQKQLEKAYCELNKRIVEHDTAVDSGFDRPHITLQAIHDAEAEVEIMKLDCEKAQEKLSQARLHLREQQMEDQDPNTLPGVKVMIRELDDVLLRDVGNKIKESGKWPLLIDTSGQASTFLRYRDTNFMNALRPADMEPERIRLALLGAIRFGKPAVLDMMEVDMFDTVADRMDEIQKGLMSSIMDKSILQDQRYLSLAKESDGDDYTKTQFNDFRAQQFRFFIITKNPFPSEQLIEMTYPIRVFLPS